MANGDPTYSKIVETLLQLYRSAKSGVVRMERGSMKKQLALRGGAVAFAESSVAEDHLARVLVRQGVVAEKDLRKISILIRSRKPSDEAIMEATGIEPEQLLEGAREQAVSILASVLAWKQVDIRFFAGEGLLPRSLNLRIPIPEILVLSARRAASRGLRDGSFPHLRGILTPVPGGGAMESLPLDGSELFAYSRLTHPIQCSEAMSLLPAGDDGPEALIYRLIVLGLIRPEGGEEGIPQAGDRTFTSDEAEKEIDDLLIRFEVANYYEILSVPLDATKDQVHSAYHELARRYHPDRFESKDYRPAVRSKAERLFTHITGAYTTLSDPVARSSYDAVRLTKESQLEVTLQGRATTDMEKEKMAEALFRAGCSSLSEGDWEQAVSHLRESVWLCPDIARFRHYLGVAQSAVPRLRKEAEQQLLKALELDRSRVDSRLELGKLYLSVNLPKKAEGEFLEVLRWDPDNSTARGFLEELGEGGRAGKRRKVSLFG